MGSARLKKQDPLVCLYVEAESAAASARLTKESDGMGSARLKKQDNDDKLQYFVRQYGGALLGLLLLALLVHDVFGTHGYLVMRHTQQQIQRVKTDLNQLNKENAQLQEEVKELKSDPHKIEKIARDELGLARPGEVILKTPQSQPPSQDSRSRP